MSLEDCQDMDLVIEAVPEKYDLKISLFQELDSICKDTTILASNTSSISISNLFDIWLHKPSLRYAFDSGRLGVIHYNLGKITSEVIIICIGLANKD